jgi:hypothetical protein
VAIGVGVRERVSPRNPLYPDSRTRELRYTEGRQVSKGQTLTGNPTQVASGIGGSGS